MQLIASASNPIPPDAVIRSVETPDGLTLRAAHWPPLTEKPLGTVCILQGRAEFIEKYFEVIGELRQRGFAVMAFDWRGQGGSSRLLTEPRKGYIKDFSHYLTDLTAVCDAVLPELPKPYFALAHSMGGAIALAAAAKGNTPFHRQVIASPMLGLSLVRYPSLAAIAAWLLKIAGQGRRFVPGGRAASILLEEFSENKLTSDAERFVRNRMSALAVGSGAIGSATVDWLDAAFRQMDMIADPDFPALIKTPTLIVAGGADPVCDTAVTERFSSRLKGGLAIVIPGARHELMMERETIRQQFWAAFDVFIPGTSEKQAKSGESEEALVV